MLRFIYTTFLKGLGAVLPIAITAYVLYWLGSGFESALGAAVRWALPEGWYIPGMGLAAGLAVVFLVGLLFHTWIMRRLWAWGESILKRVPLVKSIYGGMKDLLGYFGGSASEDAQQVVTVRIAQSDARLLGFVTRTDLAKAGIQADDDSVAVYLPMSYQVGGFTVMIPKADIEPVDMDVETALRFAVTAGVKAQSSGPPSGGKP